MGCDIHAFVEFYNTRTNNWQDGNIYVPNASYGISASEPKLRIADYQFTSRNYRLFTALANVRGHGGICDPRGLPPGISKELFVELGLWAGDAHSTSYFTLEELKFHLGQYPVLQPMIDELCYIPKILGTYSSDNHIRVIFWFDN